MNDFAEYLATPVILTPNMCGNEWEYEFERMFERSKATTAFLDGDLDFDQFEQALDQYGVNPIECSQMWEQGYSQLS